MVKSGENGSSAGSVAPFLKKCYDMVDDHSTDSLISWNKDKDTDSFVIWDITQFSLTLLPTYFKHNNFSSFIRQLNIYGFRKIDADRWEFSNDNFVRGQKNLLKNIRRKKHPHTADQQKTLLQQQDKYDEPSQEASKADLRNEVENLKSNKNSLMQELVKLRQHQESAESNLLLLSDRLQGMEKHQQQMLSFLVMVVQSPNFMVQLIQPPKENNWRIAESGKMLDQGELGDKPVTPPDGVIVKYKPLVGEKMKPAVPLSPCFDKQPEPVFSTDGFKDWNISSEFLEVLMKEKLCPIENHSPFLLPDLPDDSSWEQLFLSSPFLGSIDDSNPESEEGATATGMDIEPTTSETPDDQSQTFESMIVEMEKTQNSGALELCADGGLDSLESLTEQIELLASEPDHEE